MIGNKRILTVVTARKGSKGLPGKNYRELFGKPLFMWSVQAALHSDYVDTVVISSNCEEVEKIYRDKILTEKTDGIFGRGKRAWKEVVFIRRPDAISGDLSINEEALIHSLDFMEEKREKYEIVVNLQPTSPCRFSHLIDNCIRVYHDGGYKSLFTADKHTPFFWRMINGKWEYISDGDSCERKMRQEFEDSADNSEFLMHDNGNIYIIDSDVLLETTCRISDIHMVYETTGPHNLQVDDEYDFVLIENVLRSLDIESPIDEIKTVDIELTQRKNK